MVHATSKRRGHGEDSVYWDASRNRFIGAVNLGFGPDGTRIRKEVSGKTKVEVRDKLKELHKELGGARMMVLTASDVQKALTALAARSSTRTVQIAHNVLVRAIRHAERDDLVGRNVAALVDTQKGQLEGRPSKSLTLEQTVALMDAAKGTALEAYIVVSLLSGVRTEEARALRWDHVVTWVDEQ